MFIKKVSKLLCSIIRYDLNGVLVFWLLLYPYGKNESFIVFYSFVGYDHNGIV